jgi:hypothetical protein
MANSLPMANVGARTCYPSYELVQKATYGGQFNNQTWQQDAVQRKAARAYDEETTVTEEDAKALRAVTWIYKSYCDRRSRAATPMAVSVLDPYNLLFLKKEIESQLTNLSGDDRVRVVVNLDEEMAEWMIQAVMDNDSLLPTELNVGIVNRVIVGRIVHQWQYGLRNRGLYQRYFLDDNRLKNMDLPEYVGGQKGRTALDTSGYSLAPSGSRYYESYLKRVLNLQPTGLPGRFCQTKVRAKGPLDCFACPGDFRSG